MYVCSLNIDSELHAQYRWTQLWFLSSTLISALPLVCHRIMASYFRKRVSPSKCFRLHIRVPRHLFSFHHCLLFVSRIPDIVCVSAWVVLHEAPRKSFSKYPHYLRIRDADSHIGLYVSLDILLLTLLCCYLQMNARPSDYDLCFRWAHFNRQDRFWSSICFHFRAENFRGAN